MFGFGGDSRSKSTNFDQRFDNDENEGFIGDVPPEQRFKEGHECTDMLCFLIFALSMIFFVHIFAYSIKEGNLKKITRGIDQAGDICGYSSPVAQKGVLYFCPQSSFSSDLSDLKVNADQGVCLEECPSGTQYDVIPSTVPSCEVPESYLSKTVAGRYCLPDTPSVSAKVVESVKESMEHQWLNDCMATLSREGSAWPVLLLVTLASVVLGYAYLFLLKEIAGMVIWLSMAAIVALLAGGGAYMWVHAEDVGKQLQYELGDTSTSADSSISAEHYAYVAAIILWVLAMLVVFLICTCAHGVEVSIACLQAGTDVMFHMPTMLLAPMVKGVSKVIVIAICMYGFLRLVTTGEVSGTTLDRKFSYTDGQLPYLPLFILFSIWILGFFTALYQFAVAYSVAKYYHTEPEHMYRQSGSRDDDERKVGFCTVGEGAWIGISRHTGSLAYGAAILSVTQFVHGVALWADRKNEEGFNNPVMSCILGCCLCLCGCCEWIIRSVNKNVFVTIAITSQNFCQSAETVVKVMAEFGAAMAVLNGSTVIFQVVGMVVITAASGFLADYLFYSGGYEEPMVGILLSCCMAAVVAWSFMTIFDITTDTLLFCYALDRNRRSHVCTAPHEMKKLFEQVEDERRSAREEEFQKRGYQWNQHHSH